MRGYTVLTILFLGALLLACVNTPSDMLTMQEGRWACPSPMPQPYGESGPVKRAYDCNCEIDPNTGLETCETCEEYYEEWEQEYGDLGGPPFPSPTQYGYTGDTFIFGQRVEIGPLHVRMSAEAGDMVDLQVQETEEVQLYFIDIDWTNPTDAPVPIQYDSQVQLQGITLPNEAMRVEGWHPTSLASDLAELESPMAEIPTGESSVTLSILAPPGEPKVVQLVIPIGGGTPDATPEPNDNLQRPQQEYETIKWYSGEFDHYGAPPCDNPGALTDWDSGDPPPMAVAPSGAQRVVDLTLQQVGKPYIWGGVGPHGFDCSGLMQWAYSEIGISIPRTTYTQFPALRAVTMAELQPGDMGYMDTNVPMRNDVSHVGMFADVDGDGTWDYIHAPAPGQVIRYELDVFSSPYYTSRMLGFRSAR